MFSIHTCMYTSLIETLAARSEGWRQASVSRTRHARSRVCVSPSDVSATTEPTTCQMSTSHRQLSVLFCFSITLEPRGE